jgi:hypothetical protein
MSLPEVPVLREGHEGLNIRNFRIFREITAEKIRLENGAMFKSIILRPDFLIWQFVSQPCHITRKY